MRCWSVSGGAPRFGTARGAATVAALLSSPRWGAALDRLSAAWEAELATAPEGRGERGHIYVVEPTGPFEDDPNVTNKRFPGSITQSYRTREPLRVVGEVEAWEGHAPEVLAGMLESVARLREQGLDVIEY